MIKYLILLSLFVGCNVASLKKETEDRDSIFKYSNNRKSFIEYPKNPVFLKNSFDLKSISVYELSSYYIFAIEIGQNFKNDWHLSGGWDVQLFDIYLNLGKGKHFQCLEGRKAKIEEGWDKVITVSPLKSADIKREIFRKNSYVYDDFSVVENLTKDVIIAQEKYIRENCIYIKISKNSLENLELKAIQVFLMGIDPRDDRSTVREVKQFATQGDFGGGSFLNNNPNVVDILGDVSQLKSYESEGSRVKFANIKLMHIKKETSK